MPLLSPAALAKTYNPPTERNAWEQVQLYRQTQRYPDDWGAARVASAINSNDDVPYDNLARSNIRAWVDGDGMPDAARAVTVAERLGWFAEEWTPTTRALAQLVAGVFACGSIDREAWAVGWSPDSTLGRETIETTLQTVGVGAQFIERGSTSQGDEVRPRKHTSILGRALSVAGAPVGDKTADTVTGLPEWLATAPPLPGYQSGWRLRHRPFGLRLPSCWFSSGPSSTPTRRRAASRALGPCSTSRTSASCSRT